jgi:hypothetical protein
VHADFEYRVIAVERDEQPARTRSVKAFSIGAADALIAEMAEEGWEVESISGVMDRVLLLFRRATAGRYANEA